MSESARRDQRPDRAAASLAGLEDKVERATKLIEQLRESNYQLTDELARLKRKLESVEERAEKKAATAPSPASPDASGDEAASAAAMRQELKKLRRERQTVRKKVEILLERLDKLEA